MADAACVLHHNACQCCWLVQQPTLTCGHACCGDNCCPPQGRWTKILNS
ncbi:hypothetical protein SETIT_2G159200v2 [Setaria italica]|uniref:Uncharacterized protein n=1 Tax=Setaria italica TaxID=4555 RepID=A0A368PZL2_SETIT|nr:hypothetical protein SETIT_2G159200v2 [Setaria italica]